MPNIPSHELGTPDPASAQSGVHGVWAQGERREVPVFSRAALAAGMHIPGYAIIEQYDATTVVLPGHHATVDPWLNLLIRPDTP
jgi:N-methylhydantoinase A